MRIPAVFLALSFPLLTYGQSDWRFVHPDATLVGALHPGAVLNSPLLASAWSGTNASDPSAAAMVNMAKGMLSGITEIRFSLFDNGTPEPDVLVLVSGNVDDALIGMLAQGKATFKRLDATTVLVGTGTSVEQAALRMGQTAARLQPRALSGIEALAAYDVWISGTLPDLPITAGLKLNLRSLAVGLSVHDNVEMQLAIDTASAVQAQSLIKSAHDAEATQPVQYRGMLQSFADGATARFRLNVPRELAIEALRTRMASPPALAASNTPEPLPASPKPRRSTIVIQGLDGGPREIPLQ